MNLQVATINQRAHEAMQVVCCKAPSKKTHIGYEIDLVRKENCRTWRGKWNHRWRGEQSHTEGLGGMATVMNVTAKVEIRLKIGTGSAPSCSAPPNSANNVRAYITADALSMERLQSKIPQSWNPCRVIPLKERSCNNIVQSPVNIHICAAITPVLGQIATLPAPSH
jgi:hypothetical protein